MAPPPNMNTGYYGSVLLESLIVGGILAAMMATAVIVYPIDGPERAAYMGLFLGILTHVGFEITKANSWYCNNGAACKA